LKKTIRRTEICKKTRKFQLKQAQKQATRKFSKTPATPQKNKPKFAGKGQGWQHCCQSNICRNATQAP